MRRITPPLGADARLGRSRCRIALQGRAGTTCDDERIRHIERSACKRTMPHLADWRCARTSISANERGRGEEALSFAATAESLGHMHRSVDVVMVQCWLFGLELCAGASFDAFLELLDEEWPITYRPRAVA
jgi:hypothetical protein